MTGISSHGIRRSQLGAEEILGTICLRGVIFFCPLNDLLVVGFGNGTLSGDPDSLLPKTYL
jgi:hypothetical protein